MNNSCTLDQVITLTEEQEKYFRQGARAMFDSILFMSSYDYNQLDKDLIIVLAAKALHTVSPKCNAIWLDINQAYDAGFEAGKQSNVG